MKTKFGAVIWKVLKLISFFVPKDNKIWVFGAWRGKLYADNSKYLFEYVNECYPDIKAIWITKDKEVRKQVISLGYYSYKNLSLKGIYYWMRAAACFITEGNSDISSAIGVRNQKVIQLWHGMGIKSVGFESGWEKGETEKNRLKKKKSYSYQNAKWYWMCASEEAKKKYMRSFGVPEKQFIITGQPKDDSFVNVKENDYIKEIRSKYPGARIAVYLPTHRNFGKDSKIVDVMSIEKLKAVNEKLAENNVVLIFKPHFHEFAKYAGYETTMTNIIFATDKRKYGDVYEFLPSCDLLITDYSGIMFGYLASGNPIIYFTYDFEEYMKDDAGLCYDFDDITYGPICKTWNEVIDRIMSVTVSDYALQRERQRARFCPFFDGKSCERVCQQTLKLLN